MPRPKRLAIRNPIDRRAAIAGAIGTGTIVGTLLWWYFHDRSTPNALGQILCPPDPYDGSIRVGDFVVVELQSKDRMFAEPTWAEVRRATAGDLTVRIAGESGEGEDPRPLATDRHGYKVGDVARISRGCVYDRYRPGQDWTVVCGPALGPTGYSAIPRARASALSQGDHALVIVRGQSSAEPLWVSIGAVSSGQQVISGVVLGVPNLPEVQQGDLLEFLRDCVVDAEFGTGG